MTKKEYKMLSFRVDDETQSMLEDLTGAVGDVIPTAAVAESRRRSIAIREAIRFAWEAKFGKKKGKSR